MSKTPTTPPHYLSSFQALSLAGRLQDFAKSKNVEWEKVCPEILELVKKKNDGSINIEEVFEEACDIVLKASS